MAENRLKAGAGRADIVFTPDMFPTFGEGYTHVHDAPAVQVLLLEAGARFALAAFTLVIVSDSDTIRSRLSAILNVPVENVIVHAKHALATPHISGRETAEHLLERAARRGETITPEEAALFARRDKGMAEAVLAAACEAAREARDRLRPARLGYGVGYSETNINRVVHTNKGWWQGSNPDGVTDRAVPVLRLDDESGEVIALLFGVNCAPGVLENSRLSDGSRPVSADIAGVSERFLDRQYPGAVCIYLLGATGDQWQSLRALSEQIDRNDEQTVTDLHEAGFVFAELLGTRLGQQVVKTAEQIQTALFTGALRLDRYEGNYPAQKVSLRESAGATTDCVFTPDGETPAGYAILRLGEIAVVLCGVELGVRTYDFLKAGSPYALTMLLEFSSVGAGGGYMVEEDLYEKMSYQSRKSHYAAGTAERFREDILRALKQTD